MMTLQPAQKSSITVTGTLTCSTADEAALVAAMLPEHIRLSRAEPGF